MTSALCQCGCGELAPLAKQTDTALGLVKGDPRRFLQYHYARTMGAGSASPTWKGGRRIGSDGYVMLKLPDHHRANAAGYVRGDVHTNTIEGFWSQMKRSIDGTHHQVSPKWLHLYASEHAWRYSRRKSARVLLLSLLDQAAKALPTAQAA